MESYIIKGNLGKIGDQVPKKTIIEVYAPKNNTDEEELYDFYFSLHTVVNNVPKRHIL